MTCTGDPLIPVSPDFHDTIVVTLCSLSAGSQVFDSGAFVFTFLLVLAGPWGSIVRLRW